MPSKEDADSIRPHREEGVDMCQTLIIGLEGLDGDFGGSPRLESLHSHTFQCLEIILSIVSLLLSSMHSHASFVRQH